MIQLLNKIYFGQTPQIRAHEKVATTPCKLERSPKCDCVNFGNAQSAAKKYLEKARKLTLDDDLMKPIAPELDAYELPFNFFFAMQNASSKHLVQKFPEGLKIPGMSSEGVMKKLDKMANIIRTSEKYARFFDIKIGSQTLPLEYVEEGKECSVYNLITPKENMAFRVFFHPEYVGDDGIYGATAISREFTKANVKDVPHLYLASPNQHSAWNLTEFVDEDTPYKKSGISCQDFLDRHGLSNIDNCDFNFVKGKDGRFCVDMGSFTKGEDIMPGEVTNECREKNKGNTAELAADEGTSISAVKNHLMYGDGTMPQEIQEALKTPEGKFVKASIDLIHHSISDEKYDEILHQIDVVNDFDLDSDWFN